MEHYADNEAAIPVIGGRERLLHQAFVPLVVTFLVYFVYFSASQSMRTRTTSSVSCTHNAIFGDKDYRGFCYCSVCAIGATFVTLPAYLMHESYSKIFAKVWVEMITTVTFI